MKHKNLLKIAASSRKVIPQANKSRFSSFINKLKGNHEKYTKTLEKAKRLKSESNARVMKFTKGGKLKDWLKKTSV